MHAVTASSDEETRGDWAHLSDMCTALTAVSGEKPSISVRSEGKVPAATASFSEETLVTRHVLSAQAMLSQPPQVRRHMFTGRV